MCTRILNGKLYYTLTIAQMCVPVCYFEAKEVAVSAAGRVLWGTLGFYASIIQPFLSVSFKTIIFTSL